MPTTPPAFDPRDRRRGVRRTAIVMAVIAVVIYVGFVMSGVIGR